MHGMSEMLNNTKKTPTTINRLKVKRWIRKIPTATREDSWMPKEANTMNSANKATVPARSGRASHTEWA